MGPMMIADILLTPLGQVQTSGGNVLHAMKQHDVGFMGFGEAYFSWVSCGAIKAWKRHKQMTMNLVVPVGQVRFVFYRVNSDGIREFRVEEIGEDCYSRITVPPGIWFGFQGLQMPQSLVLNIASIPHDPDEVERLFQGGINYDWS